MKVDHSAQIISPEQVMAQSPLLIDEVSCVNEEFSEVMFGEVSFTSCDMSVQLITPQVSDVSVVAESPLQYCDASDGVAPVKPDSSFHLENLFDDAVKKVTNTNLDNTIEELAKLPIISISVTTEPVNFDNGIGEALRGHGKV